MSLHSSPYRAPRAPLACVVALIALGCAGAPPATRVRFAEVGPALAKFTGEGALIVEFQAGDRLPLDLSFTGDHFELVRAGPPYELVAKQHCFVRFDKNGIRVSSDGQNFDQKPSKPGSFRFGLSAKRGQPTRLEAAIVAPKR